MRTRRSIFTCLNLESRQSATGPLAVWLLSKRSSPSAKRPLSAFQVIDSDAPKRSLLLGSGGICYAPFPSSAAQLSDAVIAALADEHDPDLSQIDKTLPIRDCIFRSLRTSAFEVINFLRLSVSDRIIA